MTAIRGLRYFDFDQIAHVDQMTMEAIEGACRPYNARLGSLGDAVCFGRILEHIAQSGRHRERDLGLNEWVRSVCPPGCQYSARQISQYRQIAPLDPAEVACYSMSLEALGAVTKGPLGTSDAEQQVRHRLLSLGERATTDEQIARLAQAAGVAAALLTLGTPFGEILERCEKIALGQVKLPGMSPRGRPKDTQPQTALKTGMSFRDQLSKITESSELALEILKEAREAHQLARFRAGLSWELPADTPAPATKAASPPAAPAGGARTAGQDTRRYPRTPEPTAEAVRGAPQNDTNANDDDDLEGFRGNNSASEQDGVEDEVPDDYHLPIVRAVMAALLPVAQAELGEVLAHVVAGAEVETFAPTLYNLWEHCGLEAAEVDEEHFDFFIGQVCGPDRVLRGRFALEFLWAAQPPDWGLHLCGLQSCELPAELQAEVAALCRRAPLAQEAGAADVEGEESGEDAEQVRQMEIVLRMVERMLPQLAEVSPHTQRALLEEAYQLTRRLRAQGFTGTDPEPRQAQTVSFGSLVWKG